MSREEKEQVISSLHDIFSKCSVGVLTDYRGLSVYNMTALRRKLGESGIEYRVVKNTMARFAAERAGKNDLAGYFEGPVAIAFGYGDVAEPAKIIAEYIRTSKSSLSIKGGFFSDRSLTPADMMTLSTLPSKEELIAKLMGQVQSPISNLLNCLNTPMRKIVGVLQARIQQLEGE